jgi:Catalase
MPATDWKEVIPENEAAHLEELAQVVHQMQRANAREKPLRALHAKGNAGAEGDFTVGDNLPEEARVGIFAQPGQYRAYVRFSNGSGKVQRDQVGDVRGMAVKLLGVPGRKLIPGLEGAPTQDFLLIKSSTQPFANADEFVWLLGAAKSPALLPFKLIGHFGLGRGLGILKRLAGSLGLPSSVATTPYFSALPIRFGACAVRYSLQPLEPASGKPGASPDHLRDELAARLQRGPVAWDFRVQLFVDEKSTPVEDASVEWDSPWVTLARLTLPQQDLASPRGQKLSAFIEQLSFDPWHAPEEFRPLGNMMRARNHAYRLSTGERKASPEPDGTETFE